MDTVIITGKGIKIERKVSPLGDARERFWADAAHMKPSTDLFVCQTHVKLAIRAMLDGCFHEAAARCADAHLAVEK